MPLILPSSGGLKNKKMLCLPEDYKYKKELVQKPGT
jgi:hypothetical protein